MSVPRPVPVETCIRILGESENISYAISRIFRETGRLFTVDALRNYFRRNGARSPSSYLRNERVEELCAGITEEIPIEWDEPAEKIRRILFVPDAHWPYVNKNAWGLMLKAARKFQPHIIVELGDMLDCYSVSSYPKSPERKANLKSEIGSGNQALDDLDSLGAEEKYFCEGNHTRRLSDYVTRHCPELFGMLDIFELLRLKERGWKVTPYMDHLKLGKLNITHGIRQVGESAHLKARAEFCGNAVIGHTHWMGIGYRGDSQGESHVGAMFGWLGDVDQIDYTHKVESMRWQLGFGVGHMCDDGVVFLQPVPIVKNRCCLNGEIIEAD